MTLEWGLKGQVEILPGIGGGRAPGRGNHRAAGGARALLGLFREGEGLVGQERAGLAEPGLLVCRHLLLSGQGLGEGIMFPLPPLSPSAL